MTTRPIKRQRKDGTQLPNPSCSTVIRVAELAKKEMRQSQILENYPNLLHDLLDPFSSDIFLEKCFRECAVFIPASDGNERVARIKDKLFDLDPESILRKTASDSVFVWLRTKEDRIQSIEVSDPDTALALHKAGHATYCRVPPEVEHLLVSALLENTGLGCGQYDPSGESITNLGRGEVEVFMSTPNHTTEWHYDFQENFTIQLSGSKRWALQKSTVSHPLRGCTPHYQSPESVEPQLKAARLANPGFKFGHPDACNLDNAKGEVDTVLLEPGDVLYFPAGMWHKVETVEPGVSINISLMASNYATVTCQALQHLLMQKDEWRQSVVRDSSNGVFDHLKKLLNDLPDIIRKFEQDGGAEAIIPPVLRHGKPIAMQNECEGIDEEDGGFVNDEEDDESSVIEMDSFEAPTEGPIGLTQEELRKQFETHTLMRNPLASLIRQDEITRFYKKDDDSDEESDQATYVLNVNYAGNEGHESAVRLKVRSDSELLRALYQHECAGGPSLNETNVKSPEDRRVLDCLIYYGYYVWVKRSL